MDEWANDRMVALIDYGAGNVRSVQKALETVGARVRLTTRPEAEQERLL